MVGFVLAQFDEITADVGQTTQQHSGNEEVAKAEPLEIGDAWFVVRDAWLSPSDR